MKSFIFSLLSLFSVLLIPSKVLAVSPCPPVTGLGGSYLSGEISSLDITLDASNMDIDDYQITIYDRPAATGFEIIGGAKFNVVDGDIEKPITLTDTFVGPAFNYTGTGEDKKYVYLYQGATLITSGKEICKLGEYTITSNRDILCNEPLKISQTRKINGVDTVCYYNSNADCLQEQVPINFETSGFTWRDGSIFDGGFFAYFHDNTMRGEYSIINDSLSFQHTYDIDSDDETHQLTFSPVWTFTEFGASVTGACQNNSIRIRNRCDTTSCSTSYDPRVSTGSQYEICNQILDDTLRGKCQDCATDGPEGADGQGGVWTAIGCISRDPVEITKRLIQVGLGMGGGVALIMTLAGGFILSTSQGDPQKANQAKEMITNSIIGLLFVIFSVFILQFIGVIILNIPGFGTS